MSRVDIEYQLIGDREARQMLSDVAERMNNRKPIFEFAREVLKQANADNFAAGGLPSGGWAPLDASYGSWKSANFPGTPPMVQTGKLFRDLIMLRGAENVIAKDYAQFGTSVEYAKFHQYGTRKMPARQIVFEPPGFTKALETMGKKYIIDGSPVSIDFGSI